MPQQKSRPGMMVIGGLLFLLVPFLWAQAMDSALDWRLMALCMAVAALFFYLAAKYRRLRSSSVPPAA
jgi:hypothetical protein